MDSFAYLYVALALVGAALASIAIWSRRRAQWKAVAVGLLAALVVTGYFSYSMLLSRPKPLSLDMMDVSGARVLSAALREDEAIYLWLSIEGTPRFYALPWDQAAAQRLQSVMRETRRSGHDVVIQRAEEGSDVDTPEEEATGANNFYAVPPPLLLPTKRLHAIRGSCGRDVSVRTRNATTPAMPRAAARYASFPERSRGRLYPEPESRTRTAFQRDRDRIIHCAAFRRLQHKTQVFVYHEGDHYRTRLTHSLEVAQIARSISRVLGVDEDLAEALALAHDLGHPPFGHAGESALNLAMEPYGGFDHNAQTMRILTALEQRYNDFDGLNLTWETLGRGGEAQWTPPSGCCAGCHRGLFGPARPGASHPCWPGGPDRGAGGRYCLQQPRRGRRAARGPLHRRGSARRSHWLAKFWMRSPPIIPGGEESRQIHETVRRMIGAMVEDVIDASRQRLVEARPASVKAVRSHGAPLIAFSDTMQAHGEGLKAFLRERMYRHHKVNRMASKAHRTVGELFELFIDEPQCLPEEWRARCDGPRTLSTARVVADYVAGMTDRFAIQEHRNLFDTVLWR